MKDLVCYCQHLIIWIWKIWLIAASTSSPDYEKFGWLLPAPPHLIMRNSVDCCQHLLIWLWEIRLTAASTSSPDYEKFGWLLPAPPHLFPRIREPVVFPTPGQLSPRGTWQLPVTLYLTGRDMVDSAWMWETWRIGWMLPISASSLSPPQQWAVCVVGSWWTASNIWLTASIPSSS